MAGTLEIPTIGSPNSTQDPKIKSSLETLNNKLDSENKIPATSLASNAVETAKIKDGAVTDAKLAFIRGRVKSDGTLVSGSGFTSEKTSTGNYLLKWTVEFSVIPVVLVTAEAVAAKIAQSDNEAASKSQVKIHTFNDAGSATDPGFAFLALLP